MAVPAHDERDWEFAVKFNMTITPVVGLTHPKSWDADSAKQLGENFRPISIEGKEVGVFTYHQSPITSDGIAVNSSSIKVSISGLPTSEAKAKIIAWLEADTDQTKCLARPHLACRPY